MNETPVIERIPEGTVVRVIDDAAQEWDVVKGSEWVIDYFERADGDGPDGYGVNPLPGTGSYGTWFVPATSLVVVRNAEEQAALMKLPIGVDIVRLISDGLIRAEDGGWEVFQTELEQREEGHERSPFDEPNEFTHGVTFYARKRGGRGFGCTVRITGYWPIDG